MPKSRSRYDALPPLKSVAISQSEDDYCKMEAADDKVIYNKISESNIKLQEEKLQNIASFTTTSEG